MAKQEAGTPTARCWQYALLAAVACIRAAADRVGVSLMT